MQERDRAILVFEGTWSGRAAIKDEAVEGADEPFDDASEPSVERRWGWALCGHGPIVDPQHPKKVP